MLSAAGYQVERTILTPAFQRASVRKQSDFKLEWALDSAFRFFPVQGDSEFGFTLHMADLATNKILALAGRWEARDFIDALYLHEHYAPLGLLAWAAAGKDPGLTPSFILEQSARFNRLHPEELTAVLGSDRLDLPRMKSDWLRMLDSAHAAIASLPPGEIGCLYLTPDCRVADPNYRRDAKPHFASVGGAFPRVAQSSLPLPQSESERASSAARARYQK